MSDKNELERAFNIVIRYGFCGDCRWFCDSEECHRYDCYRNGVKPIKEAIDMVVKEKVGERKENNNAKS